MTDIQDVIYFDPAKAPAENEHLRKLWDKACDENSTALTDGHLEK
jgi:hypothetical protein